MTLKLGDTAPDFSVSTDAGVTSLYELVEAGPVVVYFYPRDFTPGCTKQAKGFRDEYENFERLNTQIIGVSGDSEASHCAFQEAHRLPFPLVSDTDGKLAKAYEVKPLLGLLRDRVSFVVGADHLIKDVYRANILVSSHVGHTLSFVQGFSVESER